MILSADVSASLWEPIIFNQSQMWLSSADVLSDSVDSAGQWCAEVNRRNLSPRPAHYYLQVSSVAWLFYILLLQMLFSGISEYVLDPQALNLTCLLVWLFHFNQEHLRQQTCSKRLESLGLGLYRHLLAWQVQICWGVLLKVCHRVEIRSALIQIQQDHTHRLCCVSSCDGWTIISTDDGDDEETGRVVLILALWLARKRMCNVCEGLSAFLHEPQGGRWSWYSSRWTFWHPASSITGGLSFNYSFSSEL